ncbi:hypothetical protein ACHAPO_010552 [Fusarium lateritium]
MLSESSERDHGESFRICHKGSIKIGRNLAAALRALRHQSERRIIWCDSICINQQDLNERSDQVHRMHYVFRYAQSVIIWLSPETTLSVTLITALRWASCQLESLSLDRKRHQYTPKYTSTADPACSDGKRPFPLSPAQWLAVEQMLALDWHKRLWTFPEVILANQQTCAIRLGQQEMSWVKFKDIVLLITCGRHPQPDSFLDPVSFDSNAQLFRDKATWCDLQSSQSNTLVNAMWMTRDYQCSDDRDRIFALRGLVAPDVAESFKPDYTKSAKEILTSACVYYITREKDINFLSFCNVSSSPSWIPDMEKPLHSLTIESPISTNSPAATSFVDPGILEVAGVFCDEIYSDPIDLPGKRIAQPPEQFRQATIKIIQALAGTNLVTDDDYLNKLVMMVTYGYVRDYSLEKIQPSSTWSLYSLRDWRWKIRRWLDVSIAEEETENIEFSDRTFVFTLPVGNSVTSCSVTQKSHFVRVPLESRSGDIIAALLGSNNLIVLRPQPKQGFYKVIGPCYHPEFSNGEPFLGHNLYGWEKLWDRQWAMNVFYKDGEAVRKSDPRMDDIPLDDGFLETIAKSGYPCWSQPDIPWSIYDPRMSEAALKKRGVQVQRFKLL